MKVRCLHGFFLFEEIKAGEVSDWASYSGLSLVPHGTYFTFEALSLAPRYSIQGAPLLNLTSTKTFEGEPWEVFEANGFVFDFSTGLLKPLISVTQLVQIKLVGKKFISNGLILPGSVTDDGKRVKDYAAHYSQETLRWLYSEVTYV